MRAVARLWLKSSIEQGLIKIKEDCAVVSHGLLSIFLFAVLLQVLVDVVLVFR